MKLHLASLSLIALCLTLAVPAMAQYNDIYDNGPTTYNTNSWALDGYPTVPVVSDTFTLTTNGNWINGFNFLAWVPPGYSLTSAELSITSQENGGTVYLDQVYSFFLGGCVLNNYGYDVCTLSTAFGGPILNNGTYWVNLTHGQESGGIPLVLGRELGAVFGFGERTGHDSFRVFHDFWLRRHQHVGGHGTRAQHHPPGRLQRDWSGWRTAPQAPVGRVELAEAVEPGREALARPAATRHGFSSRSSSEVGIIWRRSSR